MSVTGKPVAKTFGGYGLIVNVLEPVMQIWRTRRQRGPRSAEACGVLIGSIDADQDRIWIERVTTPKAKDRRWRHGFSLKDTHHQRMINQAHRRTGGQLRYLGTWHSHPEQDPKPSLVDQRDWHKSMERTEKGNIMIFVIVGQKQCRLFVRHRGRFVALSPSSEAQAC